MQFHFVLLTVFLSLFLFNVKAEFSFSAFNDHLVQNDQNELASLAQKRSDALLELSKNDYSEALKESLATHSLLRQHTHLRDIATEYVEEEWIDGIGSIEVLCALSPPDVGTAEEHATVTIREKTYDLIGGGRRASSTISNVFVHGFALQSYFIMSKAPLRIVAENDTSVHVLIGSELAVFDSLTAVQELEERLLSEEKKQINALNPLSKVFQYPKGDGAPQKRLDSSGPTLKLLWLCATYSDADSPMSGVDCTSLQPKFDELYDYYQANSRGVLAMEVTCYCGSGSNWVQMPEKLSSLSSTSDAMKTCVYAANAASAINSKYAADKYDATITLIPRTSKWSFAGLAWVGTRNVVLNGYYNLRETAHELGHNFGCSHASSYPGVSLETGPMGNGGTVEYGDHFSIMGSGSSHVFENHFNAHHKYQHLQFIHDNEIAFAAGPGRYRLYAHDMHPLAPPDGSLQALQVPFREIFHSAINREVEYMWVSHRGLLNDSLSYVHWMGTEYHNDVVDSGMHRLLDLSYWTSSQSDAAQKAGFGWTYTGLNESVTFATLGIGHTDKAATASFVDVDVLYNAEDSFPTTTPEVTVEPLFGRKTTPYSNIKVPLAVRTARLPTIAHKQCVSVTDAGSKAGVGCPQGLVVSEITRLSRDLVCTGATSTVSTSIPPEGTWERECFNELQVQCVGREGCAVNFGESFCANYTFTAGWHCGSKESFKTVKSEGVSMGQYSSPSTLNRFYRYVAHGDSFDYFLMSQHEATIPEGYSVRDVLLSVGMSSTRANATGGYPTLNVYGVTSAFVEDFATTSSISFSPSFDNTNTLVSLPPYQRPGLNYPLSSAALTQFVQSKISGQTLRIGFILQLDAADTGARYAKAMAPALTLFLEPTHSSSSSSSSGSGTASEDQLYGVLTQTPLLGLFWTTTGRSFANAMVDATQPVVLAGQSVTSGSTAEFSTSVTAVTPVGTNATATYTLTAARPSSYMGTATIASSADSATLALLSPGQEIEVSVKRSSSSTAAKTVSVWSRGTRVATVTATGSDGAGAVPSPTLFNISLPAGVHHLEARMEDADGVETVSSALLDVNVQELSGLFVGIDSAVDRTKPFTLSCRPSAQDLPVYVPVGFESTSGPGISVNSDGYLEISKTHYSTFVPYEMSADTVVVMRVRIAAPADNSLFFAAVSFTPTQTVDPAFFHPLLPFISRKVSCPFCRTPARIVSLEDADGFVTVALPVGESAPYHTFWRLYLNIHAINSIVEVDMDSVYLTERSAASPHPMGISGTALTYSWALNGVVEAERSAPKETFDLSDETARNVTVSCSAMGKTAAVVVNLDDLANSGSGAMGDVPTPAPVPSTSGSSSDDTESSGSSGAVVAAIVAPLACAGAGAVGYVLYRKKKSAPYKPRPTSSRGAVGAAEAYPMTSISPPAAPAAAAPTSPPPRPGVTTWAQAPAPAATTAPTRPAPAMAPGRPAPVPARPAPGSRAPAPPRPAAAPASRPAPPGRPGAPAAINSAGKPRPPIPARR
eukprot:GCRY01001149.1.p1 GENE.GCRY01001149.1~~GCRY01001149.1.p1  ORF type:complete len:1513 (-),score=473.01 GCRY01001149.1:500-5038(-)